MGGHKEIAFLGAAQADEWNRLLDFYGRDDRTAAQHKVANRLATPCTVSWSDAEARFVGRAV